MKQYFSFMAILLFFSTFSFSQDEILLNSGETVKAIVTEVNDKEVKYKKYSNPEGPLFVIKKREIKKLTYKNGEEDEIQNNPSGYSFKRNIFAYNIFDIVYNQFAFSYEHISKNGKLSFFIPVSIGYSDNMGPKDFIDLGFTGFGLNLFPMGQHRVTYFLGPVLQVGVGKDYYYYYDSYYGYDSYYESQKFIYGRLMVNNGVSYAPVPNFKLNATFGLGIRYFNLDGAYNSGVESTAYFTISMGYAF